MMKINKDDIDFERIDKAIDVLNDVDCVSVLMLCAILIKAVAEQTNSSVEVQVENTKKLIDEISEIKE